MKIETLKNGTFKATMPCGKTFGGLYKDSLIEHCQDWQKRQDELKVMLVENGYTVESLNEYDYEVIDDKIFVFSHLYNDSFILKVTKAEDEVAKEEAFILECEEALKDVNISATRKQVIEGFLQNSKKRLAMYNTKEANTNIVSMNKYDYENMIQTINNQPAVSEEDITFLDVFFSELEEEGQKENNQR